MDDVMTTVMNVKRIMNDLVNMIYNIGNSNGLDLSHDALMMEFQAMATYLSGSDNNISESELTILNFLFDQNWSSWEMSQMIGTFKEMYRNLVINLQLPGWLVCKAIDQANYSKDATDSYISCMTVIMQLCAAADGNISATEQKFINDFEARLKRDRL